MPAFAMITAFGQDRPGIVTGLSEGLYRCGRPIWLYPDPILKGISALVSSDDPALLGLIQDVLDTLEASSSVALAAPQIDRSLQVIVVDVARKNGETGHGRVVLLNPRIVDQDNRRLVREGCLRIPDYTGNLLRYGRPVVEGITPEGYIGLHTGADRLRLETLAFQHEVAPLNGTLFRDRIQH